LVDSSLIRRAKEDLVTMPGVTEAEIDVQGDDITAVHLVANPGRSEKHVARDAVSLLKARYGLHLDYRKISVVVVPAGGAPVPSVSHVSSDGIPAGEEPRVVVSGESRIALLSFLFREEGTECRAEIVLEWEGLEVHGMATGYRGRSSSLRVAATGAARALERLIDDRTRLDVLDVRTSVLGAHRAVTVVLSIVGHRDGIPLLGSALASDDLRRSAVHATLDAINRQLGRLTPRVPAHYEVGPASSP